MKCDIRIIQAAFNVYGAQKYLHHKIPWGSIPPKAQNDPEVVVAALKEERCFVYGGAWDAIPMAMRSNTIVAWHAVRKGIRALEDLPFLVSTRESVLIGLNRRCISWESLPDVYRSDIELARDVTIEGQWNRLAHGMLQSISILRSDRGFWLRVAK